MKIEQNIYDFYKKSNQSHLDEVALVYNDKNITHRELLKMADDCANALQQLGVRENDPVAVWLINTPELVALFLAISKIGAIAEFVDPRVTASQICHEFELTNPKLFFTSTVYQFDRLVDQIVQNSSVENVILTSPAEQFGLLGKMLVSIGDLLQEAKQLNLENEKGTIAHFLDLQLEKVKTKIKRSSLNCLKNEMLKHKHLSYINWSAFHKLGKKVTIQQEASFKGGILIKTSGTSKGMKAGYGKLIKLTQQNGIALAQQHQMLQKELHIERGDTVMCFAPFSLAYGCLDATVMPLSMGVKLILIPDFNPDKMAEYVLKYKPNHLLTCPAYIEFFKNSPLITNETDLSFIKTMVAGGEKYDLAKIKETNDFLHQHKVPKDIFVTVGYGKNELSSATTYTIESPQKVMEKYQIGLGGNYIGEALPGNKIIIVDEQNHILPEKTVGRIFVSGPTVMEEYYKNPDLNKQAFVEIDGVIYHDTEDLGYYIEGVGYWCKGRKGRQMFDGTGKKIDYEAIEALIFGIEEVENCMVVQSKTGNNLVLYVSLKDKFKNQELEIKEKIRLLLYDAFKEEKSLLPEYITILDVFPVTENAKNCWVELENREINFQDKTDFGHMKVFKKELL